MKSISITVLLLAMACSRQSADTFTLRGIVPGAMDSTKVVLVPSMEDGERLTAYIVDGKFEMKGKFDTPTYCELRMNNSDICERLGDKNKRPVEYNEIGFFVENGQLEFRTPHVDSLPHSFWEYDVRKEKNYTVTGSAAQDAFFQYQQQTIPLRYVAREADRAYAESESMEDFKRARAAKEEVDRACWAFIQENRNLAVNLYLAEQLKRDPFTYDQAYLDDLAALFAANQDTCASLQEFREYLERAAAFVQGQLLKESKIMSPEGKELSLLAQLNKEGYTLIDFWASWCMPCRASFPHLRQMHELYGNQIKFLSVSLDNKEANWRKAMQEDNLPWGQFLASKELSKSIGKNYGITGIPAFLLIDAEGRIVFSGHNSFDLQLQLESYVLKPS